MMRHRLRNSGVPGVAALVAAALVAAALVAALFHSGAEPAPVPVRAGSPEAPEAPRAVDGPEPMAEAIPAPDSDLGIALASARSSRCPRTLAAWAREAPDARVRIAALRTLVSIEGAAARALLLERLDDDAEKQKVRAEAARLLSSTGAGALAVVREVLASDRPLRVRAGAAAGLVDLGPDPGAAGEIDRLLEGPSARLRASVVSSVAGARADWGNSLALDWIEGGRLSPGHRGGLIAALGARGVRRAMPAFERLVADAGQPVAVRRATALALAAIGDARAIPALRAGMENAPADLRIGLEASIQSIRRQEASRR